MSKRAKAFRRLDRLGITWQEVRDQQQTVSRVHGSVLSIFAKSNEILGNTASTVWEKWHALHGQSLADAMEVARSLNPKTGERA